MRGPGQKRSTMTDLFSMFSYVDAIGTFGTLIVVAAYFGTQMRFINSDDLIFPMLNLRFPADSLLALLQFQPGFGARGIFLDTDQLVEIRQAIRAGGNAASQKPS